MHAGAPPCPHPDRPARNRLERRTTPENTERMKIRKKKFPPPLRVSARGRRRRAEPPRGGGSARLANPQRRPPLDTYRAGPRRFRRERRVRMIGADLTTEHAPGNALYTNRKLRTSPFD